MVLDAHARGHQINKRSSSGAACTVTSSTSAADAVADPSSDTLSASQYLRPLKHPGLPSHVFQHARRKEGKAQVVDSDDDDGALGEDVCVSVLIS